MKKTNIISIMLLFVILLMGCTSGTRKETGVKELDLSSFSLENETFGLKGIAFGADITTIEKALECSFPVIPYLSEEWYIGGVPTEDEIKDYRNLTDYEFVEYAVYLNDKPLTIGYKNHRAYMTCEFQKGGLKAIYYYFGTGTSKRDPLIAFPKDQVDPLEIRQQLLTDLTELYGDPEVWEAKSGDYEPEYEWEKNGTRIQLAVDQKSGWCILMLVNLN